MSHYVFIMSLTQLGIFIVIFWYLRTKWLHHLSEHWYDIWLMLALKLMFLWLVPTVTIEYFSLKNHKHSHSYQIEHNQEISLMSSCYDFLITHDSPQYIINFVSKKELYLQILFLHDLTSSKGMLILFRSLFISHTMVNCDKQQQVKLSVINVMSNTWEQDMVRTHTPDIWYTRSVAVATPQWCTSGAPVEHRSSQSSAGATGQLCNQSGCACWLCDAFISHDLIPKYFAHGWVSL